MDNESLIIKPKRLKGEDGYKVFSVRMREDTVARLDDIAARTGRSRNELICMLTDFALERCVIQETDDG